MMGTELTALHWLRPGWLLVLPLMLIGGWLWWRSRLHAGWDGFVDEALRPYVIEPTASRRRTGGALAMMLGWILTVLVLAGPVFERQPVPAFSAPSSTVLVLDLSPSMNATDLEPDRITRARFRISDLLDRADDDEFALVAFAERPYVVSPLTSDVETLRAFLPSLAPGIAPVAGSRLDLAIDQAVELLDGAGVGGGRVLLVTDHSAGERDQLAAERARQAGHRVSVLAVGTTQGAPLRDATGQFVKRADGSIVVPRLDLPPLQRLVTAGGGELVQLAGDGSDLARLEFDAAVVVPDGERSDAEQRRWWVERGPWLLWPLSLAALLLFRRESNTPEGRV